MKFILQKYPQQLDEIGQQLAIRVAYVYKHTDGHYSNSHPFVKCRDFLGDTLDAIQQKRINKIYGFSFNPKTQQIVHKETKLVWEFPNEETYRNFHDGLYRVHEIERKNKVKKTTICRVKADNGKIYAITSGSNFWLKSVMNISLYTFMLKSLGFGLDKDLPLFKAIEKVKVKQKQWNGDVYEVRANEAGYADSVRLYIDYALPNLRELNRGLKNVTGVNTQANISYVHNQCGFVSIISNPYGENTIQKRLSKIILLGKEKP